MSLLMEALRKAEEAKRKGTQKSDTDHSLDQMEADLKTPEPIELEQSSALGAEPGDLQTDFDAALSERPSMEVQSASLEIESEEAADEEADSNDHSASSSWQSLDLHPMQAKHEAEGESEAPDLQANEDDMDHPLASSVEAKLEIMQEAVEETAPAELRQTILIDDYAADIDADDSSAEEVDPAEVAAWKSRAKKISNPRDYRKIVLLVVFLFFVSCGALYWVFGSEARVQVAAPAPDRGFLGGSDPAELVGIGENSADIEADMAVASIGTDLAATPTAAAELVEILAEDELAEQSQAGVASAPRELVTATSPQAQTFTITVPTRSPELRALQASASEADRAGYSAHAREQYDWLLTAEPNNLEALSGLARLDAIDGNVEAARASYLHILELDPTSPLAQAGILNLESSAGDSLSHEAGIKSLVSRYPDSAPLAFVLGNFLASQHRWNEAEGAYSRALVSAKIADENFVSPDYPFNLAVVLERLNKPGEAYIHYREALSLSSQISPSFDLSLLNSRIAYLEQRLL